MQIFANIVFENTTPFVFLCYLINVNKSDWYPIITMFPVQFLYSIRCLNSSVSFYYIENIIEVPITLHLHIISLMILEISKERSELLLYNDIKCTSNFNEQTNVYSYF